MSKLHFTQSQIKEILTDVASGPNGTQELLRMSLEAIMRAERTEHNIENEDMSNGYRFRKTYGKGHILELRVPRSRSGQFYPLILGLLKEEEEECRKLAMSLYGAGLTTEQVGDIYGKVYGREYSTSQISRMFNHAREDVKQWLERPLDAYYALIMIDATYISTRRVDHVSKEAYYTILGVKADRTREVLAIVNIPTESAAGWQEVFLSLSKRGVKEIGLCVSDSLTSIENAIWSQYPDTEVQLCTIHVCRSVQKYVKPIHKREVADDLKKVFVTGDRYDTPEEGFKRWVEFCVKWGKYYNSIKNMATNPRSRYYFTYLGYDYRVQNMIYSTNWIERLNRDYKRTTRMRGALPSPDATLLLLGYVAMNKKAYDYKIPQLAHETVKFKWLESR